MRAVSFTHRAPPSATSHPGQPGLSSPFLSIAQQGTAGERGACPAPALPPHARFPPHEAHLGQLLRRAVAEGGPEAGAHHGQPGGLGQRGVVVVGVHLHLEPRRLHALNIQRRRGLVLPPDLRQTDLVQQRGWGQQDEAGSRTARQADTRTARARVALRDGEPRLQRRRRTSFARRKSG